MTRSRLIFTGFLAVLSMALAMAQPFEGTKWKIKLVPNEESRKAGAKEIDDTLSFKGGKVTSEAFAKQGFAAVEYQEDMRAIGPATFKAEAKSDSAGTAKWNATITVDQMRGELVVTAKDGKVVTYTIQGEKQRN